MIHKSVLILADIEGSSCCTGYESGKVFGKGWPEACKGMSLDVNAVATSLFDSGVKTVFVKDFHRTAWNILPDFLDPRIQLISGYKFGPVPGIGTPPDATALVMLGMHAPSGADGFLPHTLTSRISKLEVNGSLMTEAQLFSSSLAPYGLIPLFFSGCPVACRYAKEAIDGLQSFAIEEDVRYKEDSAIRWRKQLSDEAVKALASPGRDLPYTPQGPFHAVVTMRDGATAAKKLATRWNFTSSDSDIILYADDIHTLYDQLIRLCYLTPAIEKILPVGLHLYSFLGFMGQLWVRLRI